MVLEGRACCDWGIYEHKRDAAAAEQSDSDGRLSKSLHATPQRRSELRRLALLCTG